MQVLGLIVVPSTPSDSSVLSKGFCLTDILEDMKEECQKYGSVVSVLIPKENPGKGQVAPTFTQPSTADTPPHPRPSRLYLIVLLWSLDPSSGLCGVHKLHRVQRSPANAHRPHLRLQVCGGHVLPTQLLQERLPLPVRPLSARSPQKPGLPDWARFPSPICQIGLGICPEISHPIWQP